MPGTRVPTYDSPQVNPSPLPNVQAQAPSSPLHMASMLGQQGREQEEMGGAMLKAGGTAAGIQVDMAEQANQVRVQDALNQTRQAALNLTYDPQTGYQSVKGGAAFNRESGLPLPVEYGNQLQEKMNAISGDLGNDRQRLLFKQHSDEISNEFQSGLQKHQMEQFNTYQHGVADDAIKLGESQAGLSWDNPSAVENAVDSVKAATNQKANLLGVPATATMQQNESGVRTKVIESALENNNPGYAMAYFNKYKGNGSGSFGGLVPDDILKVQGKINSAMDSHIAMSSVSDAVKDAQPSIAPTNMDRMNAITLQSESGGKRYDATGALTTSTTGAKGEMQVEDATNKNPGFGVAPAKDNSPDERARVGRDYLSAMVQKYGGADKAWAAYNAGPGALDDAMEQAKLDGKPGSWLSYMPDETQAYVNKNVQQLQSGGGAPPMITKLDFVNSALAKLGTDPRPQVVNLAREQAEKQYDLITTSKKEAGEQALQDAQKALIDNKGNFAQLPPSVIANLTKTDPENYKKAQDFADAVSKNGVKTNMDAYNQAVAHPDELGKMSDATFLQFQTTNFAKDDQEKIGKLRAQAMNSPSDESASAINSKAVNSILNERLSSIGLGDIISAKPGDDKYTQYGGIQKQVRDDIYDQQKQLGRKLTAEEVEQHIDGMFAKQVITPGMLWGTSSKYVMAQTINDVPSETQDRIKAFLATKGNPNPSNPDILGLYRRMELSKK